MPEKATIIQGLSFIRALLDGYECHGKQNHLDFFNAINNIDLILPLIERNYPEPMPAPIPESAPAPVCEHNDHDAEVTNSEHTYNGGEIQPDA